MVRGTMALGSLEVFSGDLSRCISSRLTGVFSGAPLSFQSGISSLSARGSKTAPERMCAPTSEPFSTTQTLISPPAASACCFRRIAADSPAGPAPTTTTSYSITSRSTDMAYPSHGGAGQRHRIPVGIDHAIVTRPTEKGSLRLPSRVDRGLLQRSSSCAPAHAPGDPAASARRPRPAGPFAGWPRRGPTQRMRAVLSVTPRSSRSSTGDRQGREIGTLSKSASCPRTAGSPRSPEEEIQSAQHDPTRRCGHDARHQIIEHDAEPAFDPRIQPADRRRLERI